MTETSTTTTRSLEERLDSTAEPWRPNPGDRITGTVIDVDSRTNDYGTYPIITVLTVAGNEVAIHAFGTVLKNEFAKRQPVSGERLGIKYLGRKEGPRGAYDAYKVVFEIVATPDWSRIGVEAAAEAAVEAISELEPELEPQPDPDSDIPF
jgi:hypothetical protein